MSTPTKGAVLRLLLPKDSSGKILASLGPTNKMESKDTVLMGGRLTTDEIVKNIRALGRLRDEILHTIRLLGLPRNARTNNVGPFDYTELISKAQMELENYRTRFQETQARVEALERRLADDKKQLDKISELAETGFAQTEVATESKDFARILGRIPVRRLEDARRTLQGAIGDEVIMAVGKRNKDWVYLLVATPTDKTLQTLQTLLVYDFNQMDIPKSDEPNLDQTRTQLEQRTRELSKELETATQEMDGLKSEARETLNQLADDTQDALMHLRGVLKMGDGANALQAFAWLPKAPNPKMLDMLQGMGALLETE